MGSETLLYGYGAVCVSMLVFNVIYNVTLNRRDRRLERQSRSLARRVDAQLDRLRMGLELERGHIAYLRRRLSRVGGLIAFDHAVSQRLEGAEGESEAVLAYQRQLQPLMLQLAVLYQGREDIQAAYFAYFLSRHRLRRHMGMDAVQDIMVSYMDKESLYCRVNALQALYDFGSPERVADAVSALDRSGRFIHDKILTDGLLSFTGDHERLTELLLERFGGLSRQTKQAVLGYIRFRSGDYCPKMLEIMRDPGEDKELRLSAIRYFGKYPYGPAKPCLLAFAADKDPVNWEYASVAVTALALYRGSDVEDALMGAVYSSNWYVRSNAAASLAQQGLDYSDLIRVVGGGDRYVREMMFYQLDLRRSSSERAEAGL